LAISSSGKSVQSSKLKIKYFDNASHLEPEQHTVGIAATEMMIQTALVSRIFLRKHIFLSSFFLILKTWRNVAFQLVI
jgi:hypothetical protein